MKNPSAGRRGAKKRGTEDSAGDTRGSVENRPVPGGLGRGAVMPATRCLLALPKAKRESDLESRLQSECNPVKKI